MNAGIEVSDEVITTFNDLKMKKSHKYLIAKIENKKTVVIEKIGGPEATYQDFLANLEKSEPRFAVFDYHYQTHDNPPMNVSVLAFIFWSPDSASAQYKLIYASTKEDLKGKLNGVVADISAFDFGELDQDAVEKEVRKFK